MSTGKAPDGVRQAMEAAAQAFGGDDGTFNAAGFGVALGERAGVRVIDGAVVAAILHGRDDVECLAGGAHYRIVQPETQGDGMLAYLEARAEAWQRRGESLIAEAEQLRHAASIKDAEGLTFCATARELRIDIASSSLEPEDQS